MFVQVIQGRVSDPSGLRARVETWTSDLGPGASGWLGTTGGVTDDGTALAVIRFESEEAARRNSDRPEQGAWWEETAALYDDEPTFQDCTLVDVDTPGDPAQAGFVQVMRGKVSDVNRARELMANGEVDWESFRPDVLGTVWAGSDDGAWTMTIYFTSEAEAREGEKKEQPPELAEQMKELDTLAAGETQYFDLRDPWLIDPA